MPRRGLSDHQNLGAEESWRLLRSRTVGRLCFCLDDRVRLVVTPYVSRERRIYFRAAAYGLVARRVRTRPVTLEADDVGVDAQTTWAVTATGTARRLDDAAVLAALWTPVRVGPREGGPDSLWIELTPDDVHGQRQPRLTA